MGGCLIEINVFDATKKFKGHQYRIQSLHYRIVPIFVSLVLLKNKTVHCSIGQCYMLARSNKGIKPA